MTARRRVSLARHSCALLLLALLAGGGCGGGEDAGAPTLPPEPWVDLPVSEWPDFALSNDVVFTDTSYSYLANAFTIDTGADTVGATAKHLFMLFERRQGVHSIALGDSFRGWSLRSSRDTGRVITARRLVNADSTERIGDFGGLKDRDWLVFELGEWAGGVHPLKVRHAPLEPGDTIYAVGRSRAERRDPDPTISPLRVFRVFPTYYYVQPLDPDVDPVETSGSPVIDGGGYLVGLVSGAVGRLGVVAGVGYLRRVLAADGQLAERPELPELPDGADSRWVVDQPDEVVGYLTIDLEAIRDRLPASLRLLTLDELAAGGRVWAAEYLASHPGHGARGLAILEIVRAGTFAIDGRQPSWGPDGAVALWFARVAAADGDPVGPGEPYLLLDLWIPDAAYAGYMRDRGYPAEPGDVRLEQGADGTFRGTVKAPGLRLRAGCMPIGPVSGGAGSRGMQTFVPPTTSPVRDTLIVAFGGHRIRDCDEADVWHAVGDHPLARGTFLGPSTFQWGYRLVGGTYGREGQR